MPIDYNDTGIATGAIANIQNGADEVPIKSWEVEIAPTLTGKSTIECTQTGKNILNGEDAVKTANNIRFYYTNGKYYHAGTYTLSISESVSGIYVRNVSTSANISVKYNTNFITFTLTEQTLIGFDFYKVGINQDDNVMLEVGSTASTFEPYSSAVSTVNLGRTIYGGEADVVNGTGKEVYRLITFDGTQAVLSGNYGTGGYVQYSCSALGIDPDIDKPLYDLQPGLYVDALTGNYRINSSESGGIKRIRFNDVRLGDTITSKDEWNAYLSNNPVTIAYPLATPETFTFTPITPTPETALGVNNFYGDTGDSEVTYYKSGYGYTSVTVHKETPEGEPVEETRKFHRIIYEGQVDVISGTGLINIGESGTEYDPPEQISFTPVEIATDEGENTFYADEGVSVITYRREVE